MSLVLLQTEHQSAMRKFVLSMKSQWFVDRIGDYVQQVPSGSPRVTTAVAVRTPR
eukprot:m.331964 g.331964  ORF g.331964 m.331964 type:complete len:55 (+) comp20490_c0_seq3:246-410(+)